VTSWRVTPKPSPGRAASRRKCYRPVFLHAALAPSQSHPRRGFWRKAWLEACKRAGVRYRWHDLRHSFVTRLAERPDVSEQTIRALAGHVSNQMLQRYSHIRSQAKQAAIRTLEEQEIQQNLAEHGQRTGQSGGRADEAADANLLKQNGGPARIRTWDQRIMSPLL